MNAGSSQQSREALLEGIPTARVEDLTVAGEDSLEVPFEDPLERAPHSPAVAESPEDAALGRRAKALAHATLRHKAGDERAEVAAPGRP